VVPMFLMLSSVLIFGSGSFCIEIAGELSEEADGDVVAVFCIWDADDVQNGEI
ncbi:hypothetical protein LPJ57_010599, partial [Coemansia sp. RSA 486]